MIENKKLMYCTKCKKKTLTNDMGTAMSKNNKFMITGRCYICLTKKQEFATTKMRETDSTNENQQVEDEDTNID